MNDKFKDTLYAVILIDYIFTLIYLVGHTTRIGVILIVIFSILVAIAIKVSLEEEQDEHKGGQ